MKILTSFFIELLSIDLFWEVSFLNPFEMIIQDSMTVTLSRLLIRIWHSHVNLGLGLVRAWTGLVLKVLRTLALDGIRH